MANDEYQSSQLVSSTLVIPQTSDVPQHVAIIMDGNGRWATQKHLPRVFGHREGLKRVREIVRSCNEMGVGYLTLFAFSSENWRRPPSEVGFLMKLFLKSLKKEIKELAENDIRLRIVGDLSAFDEDIQLHIKQAHEMTAHCSRFNLTICANYGGRWDILNAMNQLIAQRAITGISPQQLVTEQELLPFLQMADMPEPDLFIRTGGESRISNFLLWQLAYTELYFTNVFWPDFSREAFIKSIDSYQQRERRFGRTSAQLNKD